MKFGLSFRNAGIRARMLAGYAALVLVLGLGGGAAAYFTAKNAVKQGIEHELSASASLIHDMVLAAIDVSIRNHLRAVAENARDVAEHFHRRVLAGELGSVEARERVREVFLAQRIGNTGYIYCINSRGRVALHPVGSTEGSDLSGHDFVRRQLAFKDGYLEYDWTNPGDDAPRPKALYMAYFEPWDWIISATTYREEFAQLVNVDDFRERILDLTFRESGYSYVMDSRGNVVVHPMISGNMLDVTDADGRRIVREICSMKNGILVYRWQNPGEDRAREKLVAFSYVPEFDWIVASSGYLDEIYAPVNRMGMGLAAAIVLALVLGLVLSALISSGVTRSLSSLAFKLGRGAMGDFTQRMEVSGEDEVGRLAGYFNNFMDRLEEYNKSLTAEIGERRQAEEALRASEQRYRLLIDSMPSAIVGVDAAGRVAYWNTGAVQRAGAGLTRAPGRPFGEVFPELAEILDDLPQLLDRGEPVTRQVEIPGRDGAGEYLDLLVYPLARGGLGGGVVRMDDATERMRMQAVMVQTEKMMSVGGLAAGMAHEINNPLGGILQGAQNITRRLSPDMPANQDAAREAGVDLDAVRDYMERRKILRFLDGIREAGQRAAAIVANMLEFARKSESCRAPVDLTEVLDTALSLAAKDYDLKKRYDFRSIRVERDIAPDLPAVPCAVTEIEQVVLNLLRNAAQAMADGAGREAGEGEPVIRVSARVEGEEAVIEVADNGPGMDEATRKRIFEPFFTTKEVGVGTGLGLSVSYFIITNNHKGRFEVRSAPGKGATFVIGLPLD